MKNSGDGGYGIKIFVSKKRVIILELAPGAVPSATFVVIFKVNKELENLKEKKHQSPLDFQSV